MNVGEHVGDAPSDVAENRRRLAHELGLPGAIRWLDQVHGVAVATAATSAIVPTADAAISTTPGDVLAIMTADCLPVLLAERDGHCIGAAHAGWRSLHGGIIENTVRAMDASPERLVAWLGPAIGQAAFEVGDEVRAAFVDEDEAAAPAFVSGRQGHWHADLYALARLRLARAGVHDVYGGGGCTVTDAERFFSYRRDGQCGRMVSLIWLAP